MSAAGARIERVVAVGGGTQGGLWTQIVSDVTGLSQVIPSQAIGASYGAAFLAAGLHHDVAIETWNPPASICEPDPALRAQYDELYRLYRDLYETSRPTVHALAAQQHRLAADTE
jgi:xylulokinase